MSLLLLQTILMSLGICILNYIGSRNTNLGAAHTLLIDSIVDLIFPLISLVSLYYSNIFLDRILVVTQALIIFIMSTYFVAQKLIKYEEAHIESMRSLITMSISLILSLLCLQKTLTLASITQNMSISITSSHFQIDVVLKICVILISVLHLFKIKNATKSLLILLLDLFGISYAFFFSGSNLLKICQNDAFLADFVPLFVSFFIGAIPFSVIIPLIFFNIKITDCGSGNPGTTNVLRVISDKLGKKIGLSFTLIVGLLDMLKGFIPAILYPQFACPACLVTVLGHMYSPFLSFSGGKGLAAFFGALIGVNRNIYFLAPPLAWLVLSLNKSLLGFLPVTLTKDSLIWGPIKIKQSFFISFICMSYGMILMLFSPNSLQDKLRFLLIYGVIFISHDNHISVER